MTVCQACGSEFSEYNNYVAHWNFTHAKRRLIIEVGGGSIDLPWFK